MDTENSTNFKNTLVTDNNVLHLRPATTLSAGEELFLVHLRRQRSEDNYSSLVVEHRKRSKSIGEELFEVHLARSKGLQDDTDAHLSQTKQEDAINIKQDEVKVPPKKNKSRGTAHTKSHKDVGHVIVTRSQAHTLAL
jgi:hypothetical protein